jgi:hypothetical protein
MRQNMKQLEVIRAVRPVEPGDVLNGLIYRTWELLGGRANFEDLATEMGVVLLGKGEMAALHRQSKKIGGLSVRKTLEEARECMPESFSEPVRLRTGGVALGKFKEGPDDQIVMMVGIQPVGLEEERAALQRTVDRATGYEHQWPAFRPRLKVAHIRESMHLTGEDLQMLTDSLPEEILAQPGWIERAWATLI